MSEPVLVDDSTAGSRAVGRLLSSPDRLIVGSPTRAQLRKTRAHSSLRTTAVMLVVGATTVATAGVAFAQGSGHEVGASPEGTKVIVSGLNNPRHVSLGAGGTLYVAESGVGARATPNGQATCLTGSAKDWVCYGATGSIAAVSPGRQGWTKREVVTGLPSLAANGQNSAGAADPAAAPGSSASGPSDVTVVGRHLYFATIGLGVGCPTPMTPSPKPPCDARAAAGLPKTMGTVVSGIFGQRHWAGPPRVIADLASYEYATNPIDNPDSNPTSVVRSGARLYVTDAGANTVLELSAFRGTRTLAALPDKLKPVPFPPFTLPMQAVPTAVVVGPDGALYVSQLTGFPFPVGGADIFRIVPGQPPTVYASGLTNVTDLAFGRHGTLYAVEISAAGLASGGPPVGALVQVGVGSHIGDNAVIAGGLTAPYGLALRGDDAYITTGSICPGTGIPGLCPDGGQLVQVTLR